MKQDVKKFGICRLVGWKVAGVVLVVLAMAGCSDAGSEGEGNEGVALRVDGGIEGLARASEDTWEKGDAIGVYMLDGAMTWEANRKYVTGETAKAGSFEAAEGGTIEIINITGGVTLLTAADGMRAEGIVLPRASTDKMFFEFKLKNGSTYRWYLKDSPLSGEFVAGNKYVYTMTIGKRSVEVTSTVVGWTAGNGDGGETGFAE